MIRFYNSLSGKKEQLIPPKNRPLRLFVCGPTVYDYCHIGHARTYLVFDSLVHYLRSRGFKIFYLQNITNLDDKIIIRAKLEKKDPFKLATFFEKDYYRTMKILGVHEVDCYARATDFIPQIVKQVQTLIKKGFAYQIPAEGWYFDVAKFPEYGKLSKRTSQQAEEAISRLEKNVKKRNRGDFVLWKFSKPGEPTWSTPIGRGRPGWHIEDTAISEHFFGPQYELHGGGLDLKFPHHEAEIAQQEAASGKKPFVKIWLHTGPLTIHGQKMSKSLKNFITVKDFLKKFNAVDFRFFILQNHYRSPIAYQEIAVHQARQTLQNLKIFLTKLQLIRGRKKDSESLIIKKLQKMEQQFHQALTDDFNTPRALAVVFNFINQIQPKIWQLSKPISHQIKKTIINLLQTISLTIKIPVIPSKIKKLAARRELFRKNKQFIQADVLRKRIKMLGYEIEDTPLGPLIKKL